MDKSESIVKLAAALAKVQGKIQHATKNAVNPHLKNRYADLAEVIDTTRPVLAEVGLTVVQFPGYADGVTTLETVLLHESGEWISGTAGARMQKDDPQGVGSALTYLRRYSLAAVCGISQEDDDGHGASKTHQRAPERSEAKPEPREVVNRETGEVTEEPAASRPKPPAFNLDAPIGKGAHKALSWKEVAQTEKGRGYIAWALGKWTELAPEARNAIQSLLDSYKASPTDAVLLQDRLNQAATVGAVTIEQAADIERTIDDGDADHMRVALSWLETQIQKQKLSGAGV